MPGLRQNYLIFYFFYLWAIYVPMVSVASPAFSQRFLEDDLSELGRGLILDTEEDLRNIPYTPGYRAFLPDRVDLSEWLPTPGSQGKQNSCVAWSVGYAARAYYAKKIEGRDLGNPANIPSPAYIYNSIRGTSKGCLSGAKTSDALNLLMRGSASLKQAPYSSTVCSSPSDALKSLASDFRISRWFLVDFRSLDQIKGALAHGHPVVISFRVTRAFLRLRRGEVYRRPDEFIDYHSLTLVGYDERRQAFKLINSWGRRWADDGFGWVDYDTLKAEARAAYLMRVDDALDPHYVRPPAAIATPMPAPAPTPAPPAPIAPSPQPSPVAGPAPSPVAPRPIVAPGPQHPTVEGPTRPSTLPSSLPTTVQAPPKNPAQPPTPLMPPPPINSNPLVAVAQLECSQVRAINRGGRQIVVGFVGKDEDLPLVQAAFRDSDLDVSVRPWPQCEALQTLDKPLSRSDPPKVTIKRSYGDTLASGEPLVLEVETPSFPSYLHIAYIQADGTVLNLVQPNIGSLTAYPPRSKILIGDGHGGERQTPGARSLTTGPRSSQSSSRPQIFTVSPPFGREMLIVLAGKSPIFSDLRPTQETEREFLTALRRALIAKPDPSAADREITAGFDAIITVERRDQ